MEADFWALIGRSGLEEDDRSDASINAAAPLYNAILCKSRNVLNARTVDLAANRLDNIYECISIYWFAEKANGTPLQIEGLGVL